MTGASGQIQKSCPFFMNTAVDSGQVSAEKDKTC